MTSTFNAYIRNTIRTFVPIAVGAVVTWWNHKAGHVSVAGVALTGAFASGFYYAAIRALEVKFPKLSWLLGAFPVKASAPTK